MVNIKVVLTDELRQFVDQEVREGDYASASEYVRDLVHQRRRSKAEDLLRQLIAEGVASGLPAPLPPGHFQNLLERASNRE
ncbi:MULTISPECIES: type II toxin-antitoxin system ParD family antitoxin [Stenotrophomonas]|jgi:antitoxin ParD1/3/4|uniref:type II toxin-antitoxin system ParD family antitoxin n=1 Tax=Stenotrophomonas TaxID=40323 RepID=UPI00201CBB6B|nr:MULTISPECIES: type II toxin-antitoxin system ParD family antitoxin [Stenotrophomonas]MBN5026580.1 type II toxin-antitoxin system ParD family antitoxin [Stenotrophomonas maltophilia]MDH1273269.1 type II toxin-antitoxin system ParD family antitoxin [Stenotrophomonas sp. GD03937]MDH1486557.1 type II toxin-antitoxin system ParD family antitoxin [Stenotrophomonas sp. GD03712]UQY95574.1 type II toxin-antitoxin system ParD family antitoxin [Stenotrophomonas maltophilia]WON67779.1 type II toxin-ant